MANIKPLVQRFAGPVIAAYLLHLGLWLLFFVGWQLVMAVLTRAVNWFAEMFGQFSVVEREGVLVRLLPGQLAEGIVPIIFGLLVGWWVFRKRRNTQQQTLQP